ncbi:Lunapark [Carabus blaptoides fortunei]
MGAILGRFRKKKTTLEQLEKLDTDIKSIEKFRLNTELTERKIVGHFILISCGIYVLVSIVFYIYFFPATLSDQLFYITPLLLVPFIIWGVKRLLTWYYRRKISRNESKLSILRTEKRKLLDKVMDTETYKVAKDILEKFAPDQLRKSPGPYDVTPYKPVPVGGSGIVATPSTVRSRASVASRSVVLPARTPATMARAIGAPPTTSTPMHIGPNNNGQQGTLTMVRQPGMSTPLPLPREVLPRDRSVLDKMVEYLVGDGPSNRYALICKNCQSHNGMALREEFEYVAFRCCYCFTFNPARKLRPQAPKLEIEAPRSLGNRRDSSQSTSSSDKNSGSDTESDEKVQNRSRKNSETEPLPMDIDEVPDHATSTSADTTPEKTEEQKKSD